MTSGERVADSLLKGDALVRRLDELTSEWRDEYAEGCDGPRALCWAAKNAIRELVEELSETLKITLEAAKALHAIEQAQSAGCVDIPAVLRSLK